MKIAEQLRKAVLQAAIQGKLTEQLPEDGNADDVFVKQCGKKTIKIAVDSYPFEVPNNWVWTNLGSIGEIVGGGTPKTTIGEYWGNDVPWITPADMKQLGGKYISRGKRNISNLGLKNSSAKIMPKGTVIFSSRAPIGYCAIANNDLSTNQGFKSIVPYISNMSLYIYYFMIAFKDEISKMGTGTTFKEISGSTVKKIPFALPPLLEQKRIVEKLDQILPMIDALEKDENLLDEVVSQFPDKMKASILQAAMQGKLTEQLPEDGNAEDELKSYLGKKYKKVDIEDYPFEIPQGWCFYYLTRSLSNIKTGVDKYDGNKNYYSTGSIKPNDIIIEGSYSYNNRPSRANRIALEGDVIEARMFGTSKATIIDKTLNDQLLSTGFFQLRSNNIILSKYVYYFLKSDYFIKIKNSFCSGTTQKAINDTNLNKILIPIPPLGEQKRIVDKLDQILPIIKEFI